MAGHYEPLGFPTLIRAERRSRALESERLHRANARMYDPLSHEGELHQEAATRACERADALRPNVPQRPPYHGTGY